MPGRGLEQAIRAATLVPDLRLRLVGPGREAYRAMLLACVAETEMADRLDLADAVASDEVVAAVADADFGLMLIEPICRSYELTLPNKLFEYAAAGPPVLSSDLPVIGPLVRAAGIGEVVSVTDLDAVAEAMQRLAEPSVNREVRERVRAFARSVTWEKERAVLEQVYESVLAPR